MDTNSIPKRWSPKLVLQFLAPALVVLVGAAAGPYVSVVLEREQVDTVARRLAAEARVAGELLPWDGGTALDDACAQLSSGLEVRVTVLGADGAVLCESSRASSELGSHADRPEVRQALTMGSGTATRWSDTAQAHLVYAAVRQQRDGAVRVIRVAMPADVLSAGAAWARRLALVVVAVALALAVLVAVLLSARMLRRLQRLVGFASRLAAGEPAPYLAPERRDDLGGLEAQLSEMARRVAGTIAELRVEQERLEAILRGMVEGVLVTDMRGNVVLMNARAREVLGIAIDDATPGRPLVDLTRDPALGDLLRELEAGAAIASRDVTLGGGQGPTLQVNGARLRAADGQVFGFVIVLHDVTELRRLEVIRRDFVANVSHELRTPLTAIKGYAETLLGAAGDDRETARRFLAVIDRHSERLGRLIDDLLTLSDLELGRTPLRIGAVAMGPVVDDVLQIFAEPVARAGVRVEAQVAPGLAMVQADGDRLRQVLINLVDNAIKYTPKDGHVLVRAMAAAGPEHAGMVEIAIEDSGIGIPAQDLPRLTERFFRVDKARSRELGGTGLGLAIVKHIVQAHGGSLAISSALGQGTTVRVFFPAAAPPQEQRTQLSLVRR
ncbi:MAG: PAS domain-containing protein [bacterium]|nr:PAS domain-containing protein [bacterium]